MTLKNKLQARFLLVNLRVVFVDMKEKRAALCSKNSARQRE